MKKILSILLSLCMVVTLMPQMASAAGVTDSTPSVSAYATKAQLMDGTFAPNTSGTAANTGRLAFGKNSSGSAQEWYVLGNDSGVTGDNTVLFAASPIVTGQVFDGAFYSTSWKTIKNDKTLWSDCTYFGTVPNNVYPNHYGSSALRDKLQALADEKFTDAEKGMMNVTKISTRDTMNGAYFTTDMLYVPNGTSGTEKITAGSIDQKVLSMSSYWNEGDSAFWLRTPGEKDNEMFKAYSLSSMGYTGKSVVSNCVGLESDVRPAANINLSDVLFASSAVAGTSYTEATFGTIEAGKAMTLRLDGSDRNIGSVTYNAVSGDIKVNRGYTSLPVSLVVQGKDGSTDWYYSKKFLVNTSETVKAEDIRIALDLSSKIDLSSCRIWLEAYSDPRDRGNGLIYAVEADREVDAISATYATREQLMYSFSPSNDGTAVNTGKIVFGKDSDGTTPQEWYILGRDTGVSGYNTVLFAADPIVMRQAFEGTFNDISYKQEVNNKTVANLGSSCSYSGSVPTVVYLNHYGSSALRSKLQAVATENFNQTEQSLMNATTVTTKDTKKGTYYTTTDKLYALNGTYGEAKITAGSGNQKVLANSIYWWEADYFWLRTPGKGFNDPLVHDSAFVLHAGMSSNVGQYNVEHNAAAAELAVQPAANLNLSSVLFASAADAASSDGAEFGTISSDKAMTLRLDGGSRNIGTVAYDPQTGDIKAAKGSTSGAVSLVVQTGDSYYTKMITGTQTVNKSEIKSALGLADIDLSSCHIWIETTGSDGMIYAVSANGCSTEAELLNAIDGGVTNVSLASDITLSSVLDLSDKNITLDLNGYTLKGDIKLADSSAAPKSILTLVDSNPAKGGVLDGKITLTRSSGSASYLYANGGTVTGMVSLPSYAGGIFCTSSTPTVFKGYVGNYGEIHGGIYYGSVNESCIRENTVAFMNGDSRYALEVVPSGNKTIEPVKPSKNGYRFAGWYNGDTKYDFTSVVTENITLEAKWISENISTVDQFKEAVALGSTFIRLVDDITLDSSASNKFSLSDKQLTVDLNGHTLDGYILLADTSAAPVSTLTLNDSSTDKSGVLAGTVELTRGSYGTGSFLYANGGTVTARVSMNSYVAKIYCTSNTPSAFKNSVGSYGEIHGGIFYGSVKEDRIKGNTVTFLNGSNRYALEVVEAGKAAAAPVSPDVKAGYTEFDGWYNGETKYTFGSAVNESLTLTAGFGDPIEYTITYKRDGGTADNEETYTVESDTITLHNPVKEGYVFTGWSGTDLTDANNMTVTIPKGSTGDREYTANYAEVKNYTVTFDSNGGTQISPKTGLTAESKVLENVTNPAKQGYTFAGWKCGDTPVTDTTTCSELAASATEIQLTAQWEAKEYTVSFDDDNIPVKTGVKWTDKVLDGIYAPEKTGYTFEGWKCGLKDVDVNSTYSELADSDLIPSITLTAQWKLNEIPDAPTGTISIGGNSWSSLSSSIAFDQFYKTEQNVTIIATGSGTVSIGYLLSDTVLTRDELDGAAFDNYSESFRLGINHEHIVYAKLTDEAGNTAYINSGGIVIDAEAPVISGVEAGEAYCSSCRVTVTDKYLDRVTVNGNAVQLDKNNQFTLAAGENEITATDKAGNTASVTVNAIEGHEDTDNDHKCDYCGLNASSHTDVNGDRICDICGEILSEEPVGGYVPSDKPVIENKGDGTTSADLSSTTSTSDGTTAAAIDKDTADKIVDKVLENNSESIIIDATAKNETAADSTKTSQLEIPTSALETIAEKTEADVTIKTDVGEVTIDNTAAGEIANKAGGDTVQIILEKVKETDEKVQFELKVVCSDGTVISDFGGGSVTVTVAVPEEMKDKKLVCVYIDDNGKYYKLGGTLNEDGTFTFVTGHFSTYAVMPEADADKVIKDQAIAAVKSIKSTVTLSTKSVKRGIKVSVKIPASKKADKTGVIIYRSIKKSSGYAMYKKVKTSGSAYTVTNTLNVKGNRLVQGKRYYYKARVYRIIDGKTYYGPMSSVKYIRAK